MRNMNEKHRMLFAKDGSGKKHPTLNEIIASLKRNNPKAVKPFINLMTKFYGDKPASNFFDHDACMTCREMSLVVGMLYETKGSLWKSELSRTRLVKPILGLFC